MKLKRRTLAIAAAAALAAVIPLIIFLARPPVLIVTDLSFTPLYGASRIRREIYNSSFLLFRRVKPVAVADDASDDILQFAIAGTSSRPFCVLFPLRFAHAARVYREKNPEIPVVILEGRYVEGTNPSSFAIGNNTDDYYLYKTDINTDFYRAGLASAVLDGEKNGRIAVFFETHVQTQAKESFLQALKDIEKPLQTSFFTAFSQYNAISDLSCVVLAGIGVDFMEKNAEIPAIFLTWLDPSLVPDSVIIVLNDSPWAQAADAVRMVSARVPSGQIPSKFEVLPVKNFDKSILRKLKKIR